MAELIDTLGRLHPTPRAGIYVDVGPLDFLAGSAIHALVPTAQRLAPTDYRLLIARGTPVVREVVKLWGAESQLLLLDQRAS